MLGEFFAARPEEIDDALVEEGPNGRFHTVVAKTVHSVSISTLGEIIGAGTYDLLLDEVSQGRAAASGEAGIDVVPDSMRDALASAVDLDDVARRWAETDELEGWEPAEAREVVRNLAALAREARETGRQVWFWWSL